MEITYEQLKEILAETGRKQQEMQVEMAETWKLVKQTNKQLGELGNKLGSFAEGLAYPTVERIMREQLGMTSVSQNQKIEKGSDTLEIDAFGYTNGSINRVVAGEIKSHFRDEHIEQLEKICSKIPEFMPEHHGKQIWGMVIFVKGETNAINRAIKRGIHLVRANDDNFQMLAPANFVARDFQKIAV